MTSWQDAVGGRNANGGLGARRLVATLFLALPAAAVSFRGEAAPLLVTLLQVRMSSLSLVTALAAVVEIIAAQYINAAAFHAFTFFSWLLGIQPPCPDRKLHGSPPDGADNRIKGRSAVGRLGHRIDKTAKAWRNPGWRKDNDNKQYKQ